MRGPTVTRMRDNLHHLPHPRMKRITNPDLRTWKAGSLSLACLVPARAMWQRQLACRLSSITAAKCASFPRSSWSTPWSRKRPMEKRAKSLRLSPRLTWSFSMNWDTCRSAPRAEPYCSTGSANSMSAPASSSLQTSASANGRPSLAMPK